jgi:hypothetical protein
MFSGRFGMVLFQILNSEADWDQKAPATIQNKFKKPPKMSPKGPFLTFCMGDCKGLCDQCWIASMASLPLVKANLDQKFHFTYGKNSKIWDKN